MRHQVGDQPIPGYRLDAFLGAGSYGEVWRAIGPGGVPCALKFISMDSKSGLKEFRSIRLVKKLQHPNLCPVQAIWLRDPDGNVLSDTGEDSISIRLMGPKELVIAMGLGQKSLAQRLEEARTKGGIPARELLRYMSDAAKGIDYLNSSEHDLGSGPTAIIHCDIKPANLLVVGGGVQVCDYGVAKALAADSKKTFAAGTPAYAPPELINNEPCPRTDQYSLAVTYYELRTGRLPFDEGRAIVANLMGQLDFSGVGPDEQEVMRQATHRQPDRRFESCEEFVEALKVAANITVGPSGVISAGQTRRAAPAPPPEEPAPVRPVEPAPVPSAARSLSDLLQPGGELVPDHFLTKLLGRGGFGEVWEARASGGVRCALKVVRDLQGRGKQEFAVLDKIRELDHPCLVQLRGYWLLAPDGTRVPLHRLGLAGVPDPSTVVISTDLAEKNLLDRLKECKHDGLPGIPPDELVGHVRQAAIALDYLNVKHHIQHRDVKPENLLLRGDRLLVSDFGLAKLVEGDGDAVQSSSSGMTLEYAAPELLQKKVSSRTDQYSLALTYYTLRTGRMPFPPGMGQFDTMQARIKGQLDLSGVPEAERAVLRKALAPNPADRFGSCEELATQLAHASGVGTGPIPSLVLGGPDLSRMTPTDLPPRMTPPARPRAGKVTPSHPGDTPRASVRPGEVPLIPAAGGGTIMFGDLPASVPPGPSSLRTTPSPWAGDEAPARPTRSGKREPQWNEDRHAEGGGGGGGRTVAVIGGVAVLLALAAVGVYFVVRPGGTGAVVSTSTRTTEPIDGVGGNGGTASTQKTPDPRAERVTSLTGEARRLIAAGQFDAAEKAVAEVRALDATVAAALDGELRKAKTLPASDDRVAKAAEHFAPGRRDIPAGLAGLDQVPETSPDHPRAQALRAAWTRAQTAASFAATDTASLLKFHGEYADLRPPAGSDRLTDPDRADLQAYYRELLSEKIRTAVPGLADRWGEVAALCDEAALVKHPDVATRAWVAACRAECRAEQNLPRDDTDSPPTDPNLGGYEKYVAALRGWQDGTGVAKEPDAAVAVGLVPPALPTEGAWLNARRVGRLADLLQAACVPLRTPDEKDLEHPYAKATAGKACEWLTAAARAAGLAKWSSADRARVDHELLLANWSQGKPAGDELARLVDVRYMDTLDPAPRARLGVILAAARPADATAGFRVVFDALRVGGGPTLRDYAARTVLTRLTTDKGIDRQRGGPELLAAAGRELFRHRRAWASVEGLPGDPAAVAAGLFDRTAAQTKSADDRAWAGLCRAAVPGTPFQTLTDDLAAARKAGGGPATLTLEALVAARRPWADPRSLPDRSAELKGLREAESLLRKAIGACKADRAARSDELALLSDRAAAVAARLAEESDGREAEASLATLAGVATETRGRLAGLEYTGRALEARAGLLKPANRFDVLAGEYAQADRAYGWSGGLFGTTRSAVHRGRNLVRWADDQFRGGEALAETRLDRAEALLRAAADSARKDVPPAEAAEAHYWLGRAALLRGEAAGTAAARVKQYAAAAAALRAAADAAARLDEDTLTDSVLRSALTAADEWARLARQLSSLTEADAAAAALDALADRAGGRPPSPTWRAALKVRAVRIREEARPKEEDWFARVRKAAEPLPETSRDREADLRLGLLLTLADGYGAEQKRPKHYDLGKATGYADRAVELARSRTDLPAGKRAEAFGTAGLLRYLDGTEAWPEARKSLDEALTAARQVPGKEPGHPDVWKWQYALGGILAQTSVDESDTAKAADMGARACWLQMPRYIPVYNLSRDAADPDDKALAERFFKNSKAWFTTARNSCKLGVEKLADDPRRPAWRMAEAELTYILSDTEKRKTEAKILAAAAKEVSARLKDLPPETRPEVEAQLARVKPFLPAGKP